MRQVEQKTKEASEEAYSQAQTKQRQEAPSVGRVLLLYVDEAVDDATPFGSVRNQAFTIMPREALLIAGKRLSEKPVSQMELRWQEVNRTAPRFKKHLRSLLHNRLRERRDDVSWCVSVLTGLVNHDSIVALPRHGPRDGASFS